MLTELVKGKYQAFSDTDYVNWTVSCEAIE